MKKWIVAFIVAVIIIAASYLSFRKKDAAVFDFVAAKHGELIQEVSVTGRVKPTEEADLAFEKTGKVSYVSVDVGNRTHIGETLVRLESGELSAQLLQAQANLETEQAKLHELQKGTRPEEIRTAETKIANAERSLKDTEENLKNIKNKAEVDLDEIYDDALTAAQQAVTKGKTALIILTDIQYEHFVSGDSNDTDIAQTKAGAVLDLLGERNAGYLASQFVSTLDGGVFGIVQRTALDSTRENIDQILPETLNALQKVKSALNAIPVTDALTSTEKTDLASEKNTIDTEIAAISGKVQTIAVQKIANDKTIAAAEADVTSAQNTLASAQDNLALKKAGAVPEQIAAQEARAKSAQASVRNYRAQIEKTILRSPIRGIVTKRDARVGEIVSANTAIISIISEANFEIEANIPEADISKISIGDPADVTLDAYGDTLHFKAKVSFIDPAETMLEGVPTYKTTLNFLVKDERIKSGMTANIDILTDRRENVIAVPQRALIRKNGVASVRVLRGKTIEEVKVKTGLRGSDGRIEITEGIREGDKVVTSPNSES